MVDPRNIRPTDKIKAQIEDLRLKLCVKPGDEMETVLVSVETLAMSMAAMAEDSTAVIRRAKRDSATLLTASLTRDVLFRLSLLPAAIGAGVAAAALLVGGILAEARIQNLAAELEHHAVDHQNGLTLEFRRLMAQTQALSVQRQKEYEDRKANLENEYSGGVIDRAAKAETAARNLLTAEAAEPGFIQWMSRNGMAARRLFEANKNNPCPLVFYNDGTNITCVFKKP